MRNIFAPGKAIAIINATAPINSSDEMELRVIFKSFYLTHSANNVFSYTCFENESLSLEIDRNSRQYTIEEKSTGKRLKCEYYFCGTKMRFYNGRRANLNLIGKFFNDATVAHNKVVAAENENDKRAMEPMIL